MLSFFPLDVLGQIWDVMSQFLRDFLPTLPTMYWLPKLYKKKPY